MTAAPTQLADYVYRGTTRSLCPTCLEVVDAKIITRGKRVYFRKTCPSCGPREDFVCSDFAYYDRQEYSVPGKIPAQHGVMPNKGCPYDCGLCTEHEQHSCIALLEVNSNCNLKCPMCFAASGPGGQDRPLADCQAAIDRIVATEGRAEVLQLSGGEPTLHPEFESILEYALAQPIDYVQINTNGIRLAHDPPLIEKLAQHRQRLEVFFQFDGLDPECTRALRGEDLLETKRKAIERLGAADVNVTLAVTLQPGVNEDQLGSIVEFAIERPWITGINFQPATYSGRHVLPEDLESRITFPQVIEGICEQTGRFVPSDFLPLPCAHPNCHIIGLSYRHDGQLTPLPRLFEVGRHLDLLANGISFTRGRAGELLDTLMSRFQCGPAGNEEACATSSAVENPFAAPRQPRQADPKLAALAGEFLTRALEDRLGARDLLRITITSFLDAYNFDLRRLMKCCTHHVLPSGHVIPFCAYNVLYRDGHVSLPELIPSLDVRSHSAR